MNWFDRSILHFFNGYAHRWWIVDSTLVEISNNNFLDGAILMAMFWWAWMTYRKKGPGKSDILAANLGVCALAVALARMLALIVPYRERPIRNPLLHFTPPFTSDPNSLIHWSSFPSDHAVLAFCIATGLWMVSRRLGALALVYAFLTNVPRIYAGSHYPTDLIAGAALGGGIAFLSESTVFKAAAADCLNELDRYPAVLYALLFAWTFEIGELFDSLRRMAGLGARGLMQFSAAEVEAVAIPLLVVLIALLVWLNRQKPRATARTASEIPRPVIRKVV